MKEIEVKILDMSTVLRPSNSFALVLEEVGVEKRKLALIIGAAEAQSIKTVSYTHLTLPTILLV